MFAIGLLDRNFTGSLDFSSMYDLMTPDKIRKVCLGNRHLDINRNGARGWVLMALSSSTCVVDGHFCLRPLMRDVVHPQRGLWGPVVIPLWMVVGIVHAGGIQAVD